MKKALILTFILTLTGWINEVFAQTEPVTVDVAWVNSGGVDACYCPLDLCLEVCWCDEGAPGQCQPGTETCGLDCSNQVLPKSIVVPTTLTVNVPTGKLIISKKLRFTFHCTSELVFEYDLINGSNPYTIPGSQLKPGCPDITINILNGVVIFSTGH